MFRSVSDPRSGFTLLEGLVAVAVSGILIASVARFFQDATESFNLQKNLIDRDQNAHYVIKRLSEILMQAGYNLPGRDIQVIKPSLSPSPSLVLTVNPRGGKQVIALPLSNQTKIPIAEEKDFRSATMIFWEPQDPSLPVKSYPIDLKNNSGGFQQGLKRVSNGVDTLILTQKVSMGMGDIIYAAAQEDYHLESGRLMRDKMLLAENIDTLAITYFDKNEKPTLDWKSMRSARIAVSARTPFRDPKLPGDGYRRLSLSTDLGFRNRR